MPALIEHPVTPAALTQGVWHFGFGLQCPITLRYSLRCPRKANIKHYHGRQVWTVIRHDSHPQRASRAG